MPDESEFAPDLSKLDNRYQILSELRRARNGRIFLARHTELNRDVTIDVVRVPRGDDDALRFLASDAELLSSRRNAHVIPVIEGRWLGDDAFAMVRPRVRGSTLTQLISALGTVPTQRMSGILEQAHNALEWARANGIVNRSVAPDDIVLQQGSGRVLVAFGRDPEATELPNACDDVRTVGQLAWAMLAGGPPSAAPTKPLAERRPDLPPQIIHDTEALITCDRDGEPPDVSGFLASLGGIASRAASPAEATPVVAAHEDQDTIAGFSEEITDESPVPAIEGEIAEESPVPALEAEELPVEDQVEVAVPGAGAIVVASEAPRPLSGKIKTLPTVIDTPDRPAAAVGAENDAEVVVVKRKGMSFGARLLTAVAVVAVIIAAFLMFARRSNGNAPQMVANTATDSSSLAAGDVALRGQQRRPDTSSQPPVSVAIVPQPGAQATPAGGTTSSSATPVPNQSANPPAGANTQPLAPPTRRRSEPPVSTTPVTIAPPTSRDTALPRDSARVRSAAEVCASAEPGDQRTCLGQLIKDNDTELNSVFRRLVTAMRRKANIADQDPEPQAIVDLREAERKWVDDRDAACRDAGAGPRYARARAGCYADQSARRVRELRQMLDSIPPG
jgi:uncharacterized protein YecT (DUF1311 family)